MPRIPRLSATSTRARVILCAAVGALAATIGTALRSTHAFAAMEGKLVDSRTNAFVGTRPPDPDIVMAVVGEADVKSLRKHGYDWPWDLTITAFAFDWMHEAGVKAVLVDVAQYDRGNGLDEVTLDPDDTDDLIKARIEDAKPLVAAYGDLARSSTIVVAIELTRGATEMDPKAVLKRRPTYLAMLDRLPPLPVPTSVTRADTNLPVYSLLANASVCGYVNAFPDDDGVLRRVTPFARVDARVVPSLTAAAALRVVSPASVTESEIRLAGVTQRLDVGGRFIANFRGRGGDYPSVRPADMVIAGAELPEWRKRKKQNPDEPLKVVGTARADAVRGKYVIWGVNGPGIKDIVPTPISDTFAGPEYHATVLDNLLHGDGRVPVAPGTDRAILFALCAAFGGFGGLSLRRGVLVGAWALLSAGFVFGAYRLFHAGTSIDVVTPVLALGGTYAGVVAFRLLTEGRRNKWLEGTFGQYLSPAVIEALKSDPEMLQLTGRKREITVLFSDVKGFTSISEKLPPERLTELLNDYLTRQSEPILERDGVIDKFIGDAVMAFFGDPVPAPDHAVRACRAAVRCRAALAGTAPLAASLGVEVKNRIGVNSGFAVMGNMGSAKRLSYTAMGDTVNLASRLESGNKAFGSATLIGPLTYEQAKDAIVARPIAKVVVVGKKEPMAIYELLGMAGETDADVVALAEAFGRAHAAVLADDLDAARRQLAQASAIRPGDGPCLWLGRLVDELAAGKRARPWDGVYVLEEK